MAQAEIGLIARAQGLATRLLSRQVLETLADVEDLQSFTRLANRLGAALDPITEAGSVSAVESAVLNTSARHLATLRRWRERTPNPLDVFDAYEDRRSLRALLRGAVEGAPESRRIAGLLPTLSLPMDALQELGRQTTPTDVVRRLVTLNHPYARRLLESVSRSHIDLLPMEVALLRGFAERVARTAARGDQVLREFVGSIIDLANAQNALLLAGQPRDLDPADLFAAGGRDLAAGVFATIASAPSADAALKALAADVACSRVASWFLGAAGDVSLADRTFVIDALARLARARRRDPLGSASLLRTLLLIEAQQRDVRGLAWGAVLGTPTSLRRQLLVTPV